MRSISHLKTFFINKINNLYAKFQVMNYTIQSSTKTKLHQSESQQPNQDNRTQQ